MPYCPNCSAELLHGASACESCSANFGVESAWKPQATPLPRPSHWSSGQVIATYGVLGPPLGALVVSCYMVSLALLHTPQSVLTNPGQILLLLVKGFLIFLFGCYQVGGVAAVASGVAHLVLRRHVPAGWPHALSVAAVGGVTELAFLGAVQTSRVALGNFVGFSVLAAVTGLLIAWFIVVREHIRHNTSFQRTTSGGR
jgi:hypothetical protein